MGQRALVAGDPAEPQVRARGDRGGHGGGGRQVAGAGAAARRPELHEHGQRTGRAGGGEAVQRGVHRGDGVDGVGPAQHVQPGSASSSAGHAGRCRPGRPARWRAASAAPRRPRPPGAGSGSPTVMPHAPARSCRSPERGRHRRLAVRREIDPALGAPAGHARDVGVDRGRSRARATACRTPTAAGSWRGTRRRWRRPPRRAGTSRWREAARPVHGGTSERVAEGGYSPVASAMCVPLRSAVGEPLRSTQRALHQMRDSVVTFAPDRASIRWDGWAGMRRSGGRDPGATADVACIGEALVLLPDVDAPDLSGALLAGAEANVAAGLAGAGVAAAWVGRPGRRTRSGRSCTRELRAPRRGRRRGRVRRRRGPPATTPSTSSAGADGEPRTRMQYRRAGSAACGDGPGVPRRRPASASGSPARGSCTASGITAALSDSCADADAGPAGPPADGIGWRST